MFKVTVKGGTLSRAEIDAYIFYTKKKYGIVLPDELEIILEVDGDYVNISYDPPFVFRAHRATDYLVNDAAKLNDSKLSEMRDKIPNTL
ncbi:MAG: hypothetical protein IJY06_02770 [Oscillospiraceae bacterium]|nr:hypothetical protein [Oscillospiraceae bacterium]MBQ8012289.1 hypothetical protein [Oscillospiraceae bacterium]MBQ9110277.1 hypothetical protein [Oscillospiraceae bacterium]